MSDRQDLNPNPRSKCASNVEKNDPRRCRLQLTRSGILCVHNRVHPDPNFAGLHEVRDPRVGDNCCAPVNVALARRPAEVMAEMRKYFLMTSSSILPEIEAADT